MNRFVDDKELADNLQDKAEKLSRAMRRFLTAHDELAKEHGELMDDEVIHNFRGGIIDLENLIKDLKD